MIRLSLLLILLPSLTSSVLLGWLESPGYPGGYLPHASLEWSRCAPKGHTLKIRLIHLDLEDSHDCGNDAVEVFSNGTLIYIMCGKMGYEELQSAVNPLLFSSPGGCLSLSFHSDFSNTRRHSGFRGFYSVQDFDECEDPENKCTQFCHNFIGGYQCSCRHGYHLNTDKHTCTVSCSKDLSGLKKGLISSPSWPGSYAENADCQYSLSVEAHLQLELHFFEVFDVEQSLDGQCIDALRIETASEVLGPFCGHKPPPSPLLTYSHHVKIRFTSDGFGTNKGFSLQFKTKGKVCRAVVTSHSTASPLKPQHQPGQTVTVTCEPGYVINTEGILTPASEYEATCQITGTWAPNYPCEPVDCGYPAVPDDGILELVDSDNLRTEYQDRIQFNCSKYYTLEGDDSYTCDASGEWVSAVGASQMPRCIPVCGKPEKDQPSAGRILGGVIAKLGEIPWALLIKEPSRGGASLINDQWAVTAAHVVENVAEASIQLYGGLVDGRLTSNRLSDVVVMDSERIIIHPRYIRDTSGRRTSYDNDIALIKLASRVNFGPDLLPICLPVVNTRLEEGQLGTVSGWGITEVRNSMFVTSRVLRYAHIMVYSDLNECQNTPYNDLADRPMDFTGNMFCAGAQGKDSCQRDSGSAFVTPMVSAGGGPYYITGIVSWGAPCELKNYKGYYTKVVNYVDWIKETIDQS